MSTKHVARVPDRLEAEIERLAEEIGRQAGWLARDMADLAARMKMLKADPRSNALLGEPFATSRAVDIDKSYAQLKAVGMALGYVERALEREEEAVTAR